MGELAMHYAQTGHNRLSRGKATGNTSRMIGVEDNLAIFRTDLVIAFVAGHVLVRRMQKVSPADVIVVAPLAPQFILMDISQGLNVNAARADELLQRQAGEDLVQLLT